MKKVSKISVTSEKEIKNRGKVLQVLKDRLTTTEKKILVQMLNTGLTEGKVRNKIFKIEKTGSNTAKVTIGTTTKSEILGRKETTFQRVKIKYS